MDDNTIWSIRRTLTLIAASAHGAVNEGGLKDDLSNLFLAIGTAANDALKAMEADLAARNAADAAICRIERDATT